MFDRYDKIVLTWTNCLEDNAKEIFIYKEGTANELTSNIIENHETKFKNVGRSDQSKSDGDPEEVFRKQPATVLPGVRISQSDVGIEGGDILIKLLLW